MTLWWEHCGVKLLVLVGLFWGEFRGCFGVLLVLENK